MSKMDYFRLGGGHPHRLDGSAPRTSAPSGARFRTIHFRTAHRICGSEPSIPHLHNAYRLIFLW